MCTKVTNIINVIFKNYFYKILEFFLINKVFTLKTAGEKFWSSWTYWEWPIRFKASSIEVGEGGMQKLPW